MLLDKIAIHSLSYAIDTYLGGSCTHGTHTTDVMSIQDCHLNIAAVVSSIPNVHSSDKWKILLKILRHLPWAIDPEMSNPNGQAETLDCLYYHFGGFVGTPLDTCYDQMRAVIEGGGNWSDVLSIASEMDKASLARQPSL
jgi:hypothetical protein